MSVGRLVVGFVIVATVAWGAALAACVGIVTWANARARRSR